MPAPSAQGNYTLDFCACEQRSGTLKSEGIIWIIPGQERPTCQLARATSSMKSVAQSFHRETRSQYLSLPPASGDTEQITGQPAQIIQHMLRGEVKWPSPRSLVALRSSPFSESCLESSLTSQRPGTSGRVHWPANLRCWPREVRPIANLKR